MLLAKTRKFNLEYYQSLSRNRDVLIHHDKNSPMDSQTYESTQDWEKKVPNPVQKKRKGGKPSEQTDKIVLLEMKCKEIQKRKKPGKGG